MGGGGICERASCDDGVKCDGPAAAIVTDISRLFNWLLKSFERFKKMVTKRCLSLVGVLYAWEGKGEFCTFYILTVV